MAKSKDRAIIKFSMNLDDKSVASVQQSIKTVEAYGLDGQEALEGVRKQFLLNKDASAEANDEIIKGAGYLASAYSGLDFTEIIQETNEIASQLEISQEQALGMVDSLLKIGFPPDQMDIISEYGNQLKMAGYNAEEIQAIFKAGVETGSWNVDKLLDGVKEGRIKLTEFASEIPDSLKPVIKSLNMTEVEFQGLSAEIASGGEGGQKAYSKVAKAVLDITDKTKQAQAGTAVFGALWEESGVAIAETIYNASENVTTLTSSVDVMNRSIKGMDDEPAIKYAKAMGELETRLIPVKTALAEIVSGGLDVVNAALSGTSIQTIELEDAIKKLTESGSSNAAQFGYVWTDLGNGMITISNEVGDHYRDLTAKELELWNQRRASAETNLQAINIAVEEKMSTMALTNSTKNTEMQTSTAASMTAMELAVKNYATNSGTDLVKAKDDVSKLAEKYGFSESKVVTVLQNWGGTVEEFDKAHGEALGRAEQAITDYTTVATNGFSKLTQNETIGWKEYLDNLESNRVAQANWWKNLKILNEAGVDDSIIAELEKAGPAGGAQLQRFVDELYKNSGKQGVAYEDMNKKTKAKVDEINEERRKSIVSGGRIADEAINQADWGGKGERMIDEMAKKIVEKTPSARSAARRTGNAIEEEIDQSLDEVKRRAANMEWKIPKPSIPKFSLKGSLNLNNGSVPRIQTSWYANGGYTDKTSLIGMGEAGAEGIVPLQGKHMMPFADAVAERITNTTNSTNIVINANISNDYDVERLGRTIDKHLNTQSHEVKLTKGR